MSDNKAVFIAGYYAISSNINIQNGWHNIVCVHDTETPKLTIYVDMLSATTLLYSNELIPKTSATMYVGADNIGMRYSHSKIPIVKIYNRILSTEEIQQNYDAQKNRFNL
jgi:hypothetical protein